MKLIDNWKRTLTHSYSANAIYLAIGTAFAEKCVPFLTDVIPWWASILILFAALVVRIIKQETVSGKVSEDVVEGGGE